MTTAFTHDEARRILSRTPDVLDALLADAPAPALDSDEGPGTWSPRQVVGHLIDAEELDWIPRVRLILDRPGEPFPPFDRYAHLTRFPRAPIGDLLAHFRRARGESLATLHALGIRGVDLARAGTHPEFGAVTLRQHLATWVAHDLSHLTQVTRVMAKRYQEDVGPWAKYLSVFRQRTDGGG
jgi:hypothetical protein